MRPGRHRRANYAEGTAHAQALLQRARSAEWSISTFNGSVEKDESTNKYIKEASRNRKNTRRAFHTKKPKKRGFFKEKMVNIDECY